jgi:hypothetical protein
VGNPGQKGALFMDLPHFFALKANTFFEPPIFFLPSNNIVVAFCDKLFGVKFERRNTANWQMLAAISQREGGSRYSFPFPFMRKSIRCSGEDFIKDAGLGDIFGTSPLWGNNSNSNI